MRAGYYRWNALPRPLAAYGLLAQGRGAGLLARLGPLLLMLGVAAGLLGALVVFAGVKPQAANATGATVGAMPAAAAGGEIHGAIHAYLAERNGNLRPVPLASFQLTVTQVDSPLAVAAVVIPITTDEYGRFVTGPLAPGDYRICWNHPGWEQSGQNEGCVTVDEEGVGEKTISVALEPVHLPPTRVTPVDPGNVAWGRVTSADKTDLVETGDDQEKFTIGDSLWFVNERFGITQTVTITLLDKFDHPITPPILTNVWGEYVAIGVYDQAEAIFVTAGRLSTVRDIPPDTLGSLPYSPARIIVGAELPRVELIPQYVFKGYPWCERDYHKFDPRSVLDVHASGTRPEERRVRKERFDSTSDEDRFEFTATTTLNMPALESENRYKRQVLLPQHESWQRVYVLIDDQVGGYAVNSLLVEVTKDKCPLDPSKPKHDEQFPAGKNLLSAQGDDEDFRAVAYYDEVDPFGFRGTLGEWWAINGFDPDSGENGIGASYLNNNELGVGRDMHCLQRGKRVGCYVSNYGDPDQEIANAKLAEDGDTRIAVGTVAMEYGPVEGQEDGPYVVKFFAFKGGESDGTRQQSVLLKIAPVTSGQYVPHVCLNCHGGEYERNTANLSASFLPFNPGTYVHSNACTTPVECDELAAKFDQLNQIVLATNSPPGVIEFLASLESDFATAPAGWNENPCQADFYREVTSKYCLICHATLRDRDKDTETVSALNFPSYALFMQKASLIERLVDVRHTMPHAPVTYGNFWRNDQASVLLSHVRGSESCAYHPVTTAVSTTAVSTLSHP